MLRLITSLCLPTMTQAQDFDEPQGPPLAAQEDSNEEALGVLVDDALDRLLTSTREKGQQALAKKNYPAALRAFERAFELDGAQVDVAWQLAHLHALLGNRTEAEQYYRRGIALDPQNAAGHLALAILIAEEEDNPKRLAEADTLLLRARQLGGPPAEISRYRARVAVALGRMDVAAREYDNAVRLRTPDGRLLLEIGDFYRSLGDSETALSWYRRIDSPDVMVQRSAQRIFELEVEREARLSGIRGGSTLTENEITQQLTRARVAETQGKVAQAESALRSLMQRAPDHAEVRAQLGSLLRSQGRFDEAERLLLQAVAMEGEPAAQRELALLYLTEAPPKTAEAAFFLRRVLRLRPNDWALHLTAAEAERTLGNLPDALFHVRRFLAQNPDEAQRKEAEQLERELRSALEAQGAKLDQPSAFDESDRRTTLSLQRAKVHLSRGATTAALVELSRLPKALQDSRVWNLRASILEASGHRDEAKHALLSSLASNDQQPQVHLRLGELLLRSGDLQASRYHLLQAERTGEVEASYSIAVIDSGSDHGLLSFVWDTSQLISLLHARQRLDRYLGTVHDASSHVKDARALRVRVGQRIQAVFTSIAVCLLVVVGLVLIARQRRLGGVTLQTFLSAHPEDIPEVQRILSAIRHEVLKHNTLMLSSIVSQLQLGRAPVEQGEHFVRAVVGSKDAPGAANRLHTYAQELVTLARSHGQRLNLKHRDATLSTLLIGMERLAKTAPQILRAERRSNNARRRLGSKLSEIHQQLNVQGYQALQSMLTNLRSFEVGEELLRNLYDRVRSEPAFAGRTSPPLTLHIEQGALPCRLQLPQNAFSDIMINLIRNALQRSSKIAIGVQREADPITGLFRGVFLVCDNAEESLDARMLQRQYIERGLGLTADLVARYDGELSVRPSALGYRKAVVLHLPCRLEDE